MGLIKLKMEVMQHDEDGQIVAAWLSKDKMDQMGVHPGDFVYVNIGWSGSMSTRAQVRGELPQGMNKDVLALSSDRMSEGHFKDGMIASCWKHTSWF